ARELERQAEEVRVQLGRGDGGPRPYLGWDELHSELATASCRELRHDPDHETLEVRHPPTYAGRLKLLLDHLADVRERDELTWVVVSQQTARLAELLAERGLDPPHVSDLAAVDLGRERLVLVHGALDGGL